MNTPISKLKMKLTAALILTTSLSTTVHGQSLQFGNDGWYTWRVEAAADAPSWCCFTWNTGDAKVKACNLDRRHGNYSSTDRLSFDNSEMQVYAHFDRGKADKIQTLSPECPIASPMEIQDLGSVDIDTSIDWLQKRITANHRLSSDAMAAISVHDGDRATNALLRTAKGDQHFENRKDALFWLAMVRGTEVHRDIERLMLADRDPEFREHAAFAMAQSKAPQRTESLIKLGKNDANADVRSQAWFWLAQTGASESEAAIYTAIQNDKDHDVREEAVFALSQLPDQRALKALVEILENREFGRDERKQALFWLAQIDSDDAASYLQKILSDT